MTYVNTMARTYVKDLARLHEHGQQGSVYMGDSHTVGYMIVRGGGKWYTIDMDREVLRGNVHDIAVVTLPPSYPDNDGDHGLNQEAIAMDLEDGVWVIDANDTLAWSRVYSGPNRCMKVEWASCEFALEIREDK